MPLVTAQLTIGAVCILVALLHSAIGIKTQQARLHFLFALMSLCVSGLVLLEVWVCRATTVEVFTAASKWSFSFRWATGLAIIWFLASYGDLKSRVPLIFTALTGLVLVFHWLSPFGLQFQTISGLRNVHLPWGEEIVAAQSAPNRWLIAANLVAVCLLPLTAWACRKLWRQGQQGRSAALGIGVAPMVLIAMPHGWLVDRGMMDPPYLYSVAFFGLILLMNFRLLGEAVRTSELAREVEAEEHRWRSFLENARLLVVGLDQEGRINYVNPFGTEVWGYRDEEILGRHFLEFQPASEKIRMQQVFDSTIDGAPPTRVTEPLATKTGGKRLINWSTVVLRDAAGVVTSVLRIGADVTEQAEAEAARDRSMKELADLKARLEDENLYLKEEINTNHEFSRIIGDSDAVHYVLQKVRQVGRTSATVLIEGETGVGKELVARAVHEASSRAGGPFVRLNCATLPPTLVESELFGHEQGAFTGADRQRKGRFELAEGGTLFLDEVGELPIEIQGKLLRVLQEGEFERVGDSKTRKADVRIIAATNRNLEQEVTSGRFRKDLFYRLQVYPITVPPLRDRREDIPLLVQHFVRRLATRHGKTIKEVPGHVMRLFSEWDWPGNVRELENVVERAVITTGGTVLQLAKEFGRASPPSPNRSLPVSRSMAEVDRQHILEVLEAANWQVAGPGGAAEVLGLHPNTLRSRMQKLGVTKKSVSAQHKTAGSP